MRAPLPENEAARLEALRQTGLLDTKTEAAFDRVTDLAARVCGTPAALITLVDVDRQWFKSNVGVEFSETPRDVAFCAHAILQPDLFVVPDALEDTRFAHNPLVTTEPKIRFYAGKPLITNEGCALGTLCVIDTVPRKLEATQTDALNHLAKYATTLIELRRTHELLGEHASEWEQGGADGDDRAAALARLSSDLEGMISARSRSEASLRELEAALERAEEFVHMHKSPRSVTAALEEIVRRADTLAAGLGPDHPLHADAVRIGDAARWSLSQT